MKNFALIGAGGFAREVKAHMNRPDIYHFIDDRFWSSELYEENIFPLSEFDSDMFKVLIAVGDSQDRAKIQERLPENTEYFTFIHPTAQILGNVKIGEGSIICAGSIITDSVDIGKHAHVNLLSTIGHDCVIGDFFTTAPGAKISGHCIIGHRVYVGTNASIKQSVIINNDITIGLNAGVTKSLHTPGTYIGTPARLI